MADLDERSPSSPVARPDAARPGQGAPWRRLLPAGAGLAAVAALGAITGLNPTLAFAFVALAIVLPLLNTRPVTWVILTIAVVWLSRVLTTVGFAPRFLDFVDFPLAVMSFASAAMGYLAERRPTSPSARAISKALIVVTALVAVSWAFSAPFEPQRLVAGWILTFEPFLILLAILLMPMTTKEWKRLGWGLAGILALQLPFSLGTVALGGTGDEIKGTLLGAGAGHHVSAGGLVVGFFLLIGLRAPKWMTAVYGSLALTVTVLADAKQVLFLVPLALLVLGFSMRRPGSMTSTLLNVVAAISMAVVVMIAIVSYAASSQALTYINLSVEESGGKVALGPAIWTDISARSDTLFFGMGPGESVSRFAFLTTSSYRRTGNPAAYLNLHGSSGPDRYTEVVKGGAYTGESSFTSPQSSAFGILGDYGIIGVLAFLLLIGTVLQRLRRADDARREMAAAALASWTLLLPLAVIFDWLEQPPFTLAVVLLTGLALKAPDEMEQDHAPSGAVGGTGASPPTAHDAAATNAHVARRGGRRPAHRSGSHPLR